MLMYANSCVAIGIVTELHHELNLRFTDEVVFRRGLNVQRITLNYSSVMIESNAKMFCT